MPNRRPTRSAPPAAPNSPRVSPGKTSGHATASPAKARTKSTVLVIRLSPDDRALIEAAADDHELEMSTWARQTLVLAAKRWRAQQGTPPITPRGSNPTAPPEHG